MLVLLKSYPEHAANAPFVYARRVGVGEAAHVFDVEDLDVGKVGGRHDEQNKLGDATMLPLARIKNNHYKIVKFTN